MAWCAGRNDVSSTSSASKVAAKTRRRARPRALALGCLLGGVAALVGLVLAIAITGRDPVSGDWILERGAKPVVSVDQFAVVPGDQSPAPVVTRTGRVRLRDAGMRVVVLGRAIGCCEWCGVPGFLREDGSRYLEVHHIVSLADDGADHPLNMIALCPNHHREAHHSVAREAMRAEMAARVRRLMGPGTDRGPHPDE